MAKRIILFFIIIILGFSMLSLAQSKFNFRWATRSINMTPSTAVDGMNVTFSSKVMVKGMTMNNVTVIVKMDGRTVLTRTGLRLTENIPLKISYNWVARFGSHEIKFIVDPKNDYTETNELDNVQSKQFKVGPKLQIAKPPVLTTISLANIPKLPDLKIKKVWVTFLDIYPTQSRVKIWVRAENAGLVASSNCQMKTTVDGISSPYFADVASYWFEKNQPMYGMSPNGTYDYGFELLLKSGKYKVIAYADSTGTVTESNDTNNSNFVEFHVVRRAD